MEYNLPLVGQREATYPTYPRLEEVTSPGVNTAHAAHYLNRANQTLRIWAMGRSNAPITPLRIHGRLAWPVARIKELLGVAA
jgi:hypothetical protein